MARTQRQIRGDIVKVAGMMYRSGMVNAFEGNVSVRCGNKVYFTPSGVCKGILKRDMIVVTDLDGSVLSAKQGCKLTSEAKMHLSVYRLRPDAGSVVHTHSPWATAFAVANRPIATKAYPEMIVLFGDIPVAQYGTPSTDDVSCDFAALFKERDAILIANHGVVSLGSDVSEAYYRMEAVECCARVLALAQMIGGPADLDENNLGCLRMMRRAMFGRD